MIAYGTTVVVTKSCVTKRWHGLRGKVVWVPTPHDDGQYGVMLPCGRVLKLLPWSIRAE